jgi:hypothetical protein
VRHKETLNVCLTENATIVKNSSKGRGKINKIQKLIKGVKILKKVLTKEPFECVKCFENKIKMHKS